MKHRLLDSARRLAWAALFCLFGASMEADTVTPLYSFANGNDGAGPWGGLLEATDGNLYGTTTSGGIYHSGTVFRVSKSGAFTSLFSFTGGVDGATPAAGLIQAWDGGLYGTATAGGSNGVGTVFRITTGGVLTPLHSYTAMGDGAFPMGRLVQASDGYLYGTTFGGVLGFGTIFRISTSGLFTVLHTFSNGEDGGKPEAVALVQARDGNLYGTTTQGGTYGYGTLFRISPDGTFESLHAFTHGADGAKPRAGLTEGRDGFLYGTAEFGGTHNAGTVYRISLDGAFTALYSFTGGLNGRGPTSNLIETSDGYFYGTANIGGTNKFGQIFGVNANGAFKSVFVMTPFTGGNTAQGIGLIRASDGALYGTGTSGGINLYGTVFRVSGTEVPPMPLQIQSPRISLGTINFTFFAEANRNYTIELNTNLASPQWTAISNVAGNGTLFQFAVPSTLAPSAFFRIHQF